MKIYNIWSLILDPVNCDNKDIAITVVLSYVLSVFTWCGHLKMSPPLIGNMAEALISWKMLSEISATFWDCDFDHFAADSCIKY